MSPPISNLLRPNESLTGVDGAIGRVRATGVIDGVCGVAGVAGTVVRGVLVVDGDGE